MPADYRIPSDGASAESPEAHDLPTAFGDAPTLVWRAGGLSPGARALPEETPVAITYNRLSHAVMMATPTDLRDFALGFTLNERIVEDPSEIEEIEIVSAPRGAVELRLWIGPAHMVALDHRRRHQTGAMGCGLCGLDSLEEAMRPLPRVNAGLTLTGADIMAAVASLYPAQVLAQKTRAVHAAAFWRRDAGLIAIREDVGRHNALDKLAGGLRQMGEAPASGVLVMTSRVSIELIQKAAMMGVGVLAAVSAPTRLAIREAEAVGLTLIGIARDDGFEVFTGAHRILG